MTNLFIRIGVGFVILVGLLLATGLIITKAMPDGTEQFSGVAAAAARNALQHAYGFYDNPIKRGAYIHKYKVVAVQIKGPPPKVPTPPPRDDSEPRPALEPTSGGGVVETDETGSPVPVYQARVRTYTLFATPVDTIVVDTVDGYSGWLQ